MTQNDPRILTREQLNRYTNLDHPLIKHVEALTEALEYISGEAYWLDDAAQKAQAILDQIDPPPPAQTISAARLDGKVRL